MAAHRRRSGGSVQGEPLEQRMRGRPSEEARTPRLRPSARARLQERAALGQRRTESPHDGTPKRLGSRRRQPRVTRGFADRLGPHVRAGCSKTTAATAGPPPFRSTKYRFLEPAREEAEQREHQHDNQNDPENAQRVPSFPYACPFNGVDGKPVTRTPPGGFVQTILGNRARTG